MVVLTVSIFSSDINVLTILTKYHKPTLITVITKDIATGLYVFVDALG